VPLRCIPSTRTHVEPLSAAGEARLARLDADLARLRVEGDFGRGRAAGDFVWLRVASDFIWLRAAGVVSELDPDRFRDCSRPAFGEEAGGARHHLARAVDALPGEIARHLVAHDGELCWQQSVEGGEGRPLGKLGAGARTPGARLVERGDGRRLRDAVHGSKLRRRPARPRARLAADCAARASALNPLDADLQNLARSRAAVIAIAHSR